MSRSRPPRMARLDKRNNALTQIIRKGDPALQITS